MKISVRLYHGFSLINHKGRDFLVWFQLPKYKASISTTVESQQKLTWESDISENVAYSLPLSTFFVCFLWETSSYLGFRWSLYSEINTAGL